MLPSAGPSFSSIELQTLVDANEVEEPLCWELWKWRHKWKQMIFKKYEYPQHVPAGHMSWRGFSVPCVKYLFTLLDGYVDAWEESNFFHWNYTFGNLTLLERSLIHQVKQCACKNTLMYAPTASPYSTNILAGKTEELYALCRLETVFLETLLTQQAVEEPKSLAGCVLCRIPQFYNSSLCWNLCQFCSKREKSLWQSMDKIKCQGE